MGVVVEFVNPKYKPGSRTEFKKPTRLECMMQDFPKLMAKELGDSAKVTHGRGNFRVVGERLAFSVVLTSFYFIGGGGDGIGRSSAG